MDNFVYWDDVMNETLKKEFYEESAQMYHDLLDEHIAALKNDADKPKFTQIPPDVVLDIAKAFTYGDNKYGGYNYSKGMEWCRLVDASQRHILSFLTGEDIDESGNHHIDHAIASLIMLKHNINRNIGIDNRNKIFKTEK